MPLIRAVLIFAYLAVPFFIHKATALTLDPREAQTMMQAMDLEWIRQNFWQCLIYNHYQPPLFANILLGGIYCLARQWTIPLFLALNAAAAFAAFFAFLNLLEKMKVSRWVLFLTALAFIVFPTRLEWDQSILYMSLSASLMTLSLWASMRLMERPCPGRFWVLVIAVWALTILNSFFHWTWGLTTLGLGAALAGVWRDRLRHLVLAATLLLLWPAKNLVIFGTPSNSSCMGIVLSQRVGVFPPLLLQLIRQGELPKDATCLLDPYGSKTYLAAGDPAPEAFKNIRCMMDPWKGSHRDGLGVYSLFNYNYHTMIPVSRRQTRYALWYLRHYPKFYWSITRAQAIDFLTTTDPIMDPAVALPRKIQFKSSNGISYRSLVYLISLIPGLLCLARTRKQGGPRWKGMVFVLFQISFAVGMGVFVAYSDGTRYRYPFETAFLIFTAGSLSWVFSGIRNRVCRVR